MILLFNSSVCALLHVRAKRSLHVNNYSVKKDPQIKEIGKRLSFYRKITNIVFYHLNKGSIFVSFERKRKRSV